MWKINTSGVKIKPYGVVDRQHYKEFILNTGVSTSSGLLKIINADIVFQTAITGVEATRIPVFPRRVWTLRELGQEVLPEGLHGGEGLTAGLLDLGGGQEEAVAAGVPQLDHVRVLGAQLAEAPVHAAAGRRICTTTQRRRRASVRQRGTLK